MNINNPSVYELTVCLLAMLVLITLFCFFRAGQSRLIPLTNKQVFFVKLSLLQEFKRAAVPVMRSKAFFDV
jgi:hypothetical protein